MQRPVHSPAMPRQGPLGWRRWLLGARVRTLPAAVVPVLVGTAAVTSPGRLSSVRYDRAALALVVAVALQVATNLANDYADGRRGVDDPAHRVGPPRLVGSGLGSPEEVRRAMLMAFAVALVAGGALVLLVGWELIPVGVAAVAAGWFYTGGPRPYGYAGWGEVFVFTFFGLVATVGSAYVQVESIPWLPVLCGVAVGSFATALLVINNLRDLVGDRAAGKRTLAVRFGDRRTRILYTALVVLPFVLLPAIAGTSGRPLAALGFGAILWCRPPVLTVLSGATSEALIPALAATSRAQLAYGVAVAVGLVIQL